MSSMGSIGRNIAWLLSALTLTPFVALTATPASALVNYDVGQRTIDGIQLLQDASDASAYYYLPQ